MDATVDGSGVVIGQRLYQLVRQKGAIRDRSFTIEFLEPDIEAFSSAFACVPKRDSVSLAEQGRLPNCGWRCVMTASSAQRERLLGSSSNVHSYPEPSPK